MLRRRTSDSTSKKREWRVVSGHCSRLKRTGAAKSTNTPYGFNFALSQANDNDGGEPPHARQATHSFGFRPYVNISYAVAADSGTNVVMSTLRTVKQTDAQSSVAGHP